MKKHRLWHGFLCTYLQRVDFFVSKTTSTLPTVQKPSEKSSKPNVRLQITSNRTPLTRNRGGGGVVMTTASTREKIIKSREGSNPREALFRISISEKSSTRSYKRRKPEISRFQQKVINFGVLFDAFTSGVSIFRV